MKKTDDEKYYVVKTVKSIDEKEAADIREKKTLSPKSAARNDIRKVKNEKRRIKSYFMDGQTKPKENKMGTMPVNKLLISMSVPMMISMLVQALYNVVDSMFVAQLNENALTAVSLVFLYRI